ncbi:hypothetical protein ACF9IK_13515 [Kitasatospora hibisci]|uniref:hypothetical protein n=1 Tax=Kitasatospora hibisci TaxID=3369522 RepID=UPI003754DA09
MAPVDPHWLEGLPPIPDSWQLSDENAARLDRMMGRLPSQLRKSAYWTLRVSEVTNEYIAVIPAEGLTPGFQYAGVGFLDPDLDRVDPGTFGVIMYSTVEPTEQQERDIAVLTIEERFRFPVVWRTVFFEEHVSVTSAPGGSVACWARSRIKRPNPREGWLTAAHVVRSSRNNAVFSDGGVGQVVDQASVCIDAAVVSTSQPLTNRSKLTVTPAVPGLAVSFPQLAGGTVSATIWEVASTFGQLSSAHFPLRFAMDTQGVPGDSGSLISSTHGDIVGIYLGSYTSSSAQAVSYPTGGVGLSAEHLEALMGMEFYS